MNREIKKKKFKDILMFKKLTLLKDQKKNFIILSFYIKESL